MAVDFVKLTSGLAGEVNQAYVGDGVATRMIVPACPALDLGRGRGFSLEGWINPFNVTNPAPLVEWYDSTPAHQPVPAGRPVLAGVDQWSRLPRPLCFGTPTPSPMSSALQPLALTNGGWQHVALTYDTNSDNAVLYTNGQPAATVQFPTDFVPRTSGDLYLGFDPTIIPTPINYPNFSSTAGLNLVGNAAQNGSVLRLTPAVTRPIGQRVGDEQTTLRRRL